MKQLLYVIVVFCGLLFSCEREALNQSSKVIVALPGSENALQNILNPFSSVSIASEDDDDDDDFNSTIQPSFGATALFPVNCYLVAIGSQKNESFFTKNYCGKRSTVTGNIDRNFEFGPFVGLFSNSGSVELDVPAGEKRFIYVFGVHALNPAACVTLAAGQGQNPSRSNFSKFFLVGTSATFTVTSGQTSVIPINLNQPLATNYIDQCVFPAVDNEKDSPADKITVNRDSFPYKIINIQTTGASPTYLCDYFDFVPRHGDVPARVDGPKRIKLLIANSQTDTYASKTDCISDTNPASDFTINSDSKKFRRWVGFGQSPNGDQIVKAESVDGSLASDNKTFKLIPGRVTSDASELNDGTNYFSSAFDLVIPSKIIKDQCYQFITTRKTLEDHNLTHPSIVTSVNFTILPPAAVQLFLNSDCTDNDITATTIAASNYYVSHSFKANDNFIISASAGVNGFTTPTATSKTYSITVSDKVTNQTPASVEINAPAVVHSRASSNCSPILFRFKNSDRATVKTPAIGSITILFDQNQNVSGSTRFFDDENCASLNELTATTPSVNFVAGLEFKKIYMLNSASVPLGNKTVRFKVFDGAKTYFQKYEVEVVAQNP